MDTIVNASTALDEVVLQNDNGTVLRFNGKLFSESSYYEDETEVLTRLRLYTSNDGLLIYSIVAGAGSQKSRRCYSVRIQGEVCTMSDGIQTISVPIEMLFASVFGLCGIDPDRAEELRPLLEETLRAVNAE